MLSIPVKLPLVGAGKYGAFKDVFTFGKADAAWAASIFHFKEIADPALKGYFDGRGNSIRVKQPLRYYLKRTD